MAEDTLFRAINRRSGEADSDTEEQPLADALHKADSDAEEQPLAEEFHKVRDTLRGFLAAPQPGEAPGIHEPKPSRRPEARAAGQDEAADELLRAPLIWLLASMGKQDHLPVAALAAALQRAGYRVKAFGAGSYEHIFARLGVAFEAHDEHVLMHRYNYKAKQWLKESSEAAGLTGPEKEEDFFFDLHILRLEFTCCLTFISALDENQKHDFAVAAVLAEKRFNDLFIRSDCSDDFMQFIRERFMEVLTWRSEDRRRSVENYEPIRRAYLQSFRDFLRQKAKEGGYDLIDVIETLRFEFAKTLAKLMEEAASEGRDASSILKAEIGSFLAWLNGQSPREWWECWTAKLPAWIDEISRVRTSQHTVPKAMHNVILTMDNLDYHERPDLVLFDPGLMSVGLMLEAQYQLKTAMLWPFQMALHRPTHVVLYNILANEERKERIPFTPIQDMGPMAFGDYLWSDRQISGQSLVWLRDEFLTAELRSCPVVLQSLRDRSTGLWTVGGDPPLLPPDEPLLFHAEGDYERALRFLGDGTDPPICMGWGSRPHPKHPERLVCLVAESLHAVGRRGIFLVGKSGATLELLRDVGNRQKEDKEFQQVVEYAARRILFLVSAPHGWLFPHCACVVHNGGNGTVQAALCAGIPQVMAPPAKQVIDLPDNSSLIKKLGCGMDVTSLEDLTADKLAASLRTVLGDKDMKAKAAGVAQSLQRQPGVLGAVALVSDLLRAAPEPTAPEVEACPWQDGVWGFYFAGTRAGGNIVRGGRWYSPTGEQNGWVRYGTFRTEQQKGLPQGHSVWNVQAYWPGANKVAYGVVGSEGKRITWDDLNIHMWESELPATPQEEESFLATFPPFRLLGGIFDHISHQISGNANSNS